MRILWIGGNHPRHLYYINKIHSEFPIIGGIVECREDMIPLPPAGLENQDRDNFTRHFNDRYLAEKRHFGSQPTPDIPLLKVTEDTINDDESVAFIKKMRPDIVFVFGSNMIREPLFSALPHNTINLHLGLSPRYRGAATLFWPFYFMEPTYAGTTFHYILSEPDAGDVIHQVVPELDPSDGIHDVACKALLSSADDALRLLDIYRKKREWIRHKQRGTGKNFLASDFKPEHLRVIYNTFSNDMVKLYLEGKLSSKKPSLFRQI